MALEPLPRLRTYANTYAGSSLNDPRFPDYSLQISKAMQDSLANPDYLVIDWQDTNYMYRAFKAGQSR
jgi:hypothetical protein